MASSASRSGDLDHGGLQRSEVGMVQQFNNPVVPAELVGRTLALDWQFECFGACPPWGSVALRPSVGSHGAVISTVVVHTGG
jgi:hypothetical protein